MKAFYFTILACMGILFCGCRYDYEENNSQKLEYNGNIYECWFMGRSCVYSKYCVVEKASYERGVVKCRYDNFYDYGYNYLYFSGTPMSCYFNGERCLDNLYCKDMSYNRIECSR